jgi:hypothetical protein
VFGRVKGRWCLRRAGGGYLSSLNFLEQIAFWFKDFCFKNSEVHEQQVATELMHEGFFFFTSSMENLSQLVTQDLMHEGSLCLYVTSLTHM